MPVLSRIAISSTYERIRHLVRKTPCIVSPDLPEAVSDLLHNETKLKVFFKCENQQLSGSFKYRGVLNKLLQLNRHQLNNGVATYSTVVRLGEDLQWCEEKATESCSRNGMTFVPPANDMDIVLGQATAAFELCDQVKAAGYGELDMVVAPCGGGSLLSGCVSWFQDTPTQVWGAEPLIDGPGLHASLKAGVLLPKTKGGATIADGQRTTISPEIWSILKDQTTLRGSIAVTEAQIRQALSWYYSAFGHVIEPSAAVAIAACASVFMSVFIWLKGTIVFRELISQYIKHPSSDLKMTIEPLRVLLLGSGGREHALAWKLNQSSLVELIIVCPGNAATSELSKAKNFATGSIPNALTISQAHRVNLAIFTRELDLSGGAVDIFIIEGIRCIGPPEKSALLETSKVFAKHFMHKHNIPKAPHRTFFNHQDALSFIKHEFSLGKQKVVLKNPTIADGRGVFIVETFDGAADILNREFARNLDSSSSHSFPDILVEEFIAGPEFTIMALTDGESFTMCPPYLDFKKRKDNDEGPLTGGMGCICPTVRCDWPMFRHLQQTFMARTVKGLKEDDLSFAGFIAIGIVVSERGPVAIEYDLRLGDPETQALMPLLNPELDLAAVLIQCQKLSIKSKVTGLQGILCCYSPSGCNKRIPNKLSPPAPRGGFLYIERERYTFFSSTDQGVQTLRARGGRVISVCGLGSTRDIAAERAYSGMAGINFRDIDYRHDLGIK
ncbi:phosphoribosylglycinamide synthetase [Fusarium flagelliforme]|uniref:phosphoribosylglycinamide synthetase n=1 Tax=Fusarium flagelliforme TaxID=2675880 RepID=UPI001E8E53D5|nr:phosphoribosylglycinamide synthetase [Fusarium flagelliforme]KAH7173600.1 phosphoribosylglycinamide synthetase [Fusarium flagelliforme]